MNFAFILTDFSGGGAEKAVLKLLILLEGRGHNVQVIVFRDKPEYSVPDNISPIVLAQQPSFGWIGKRVLAYKLNRKVRELEAQCGRFDVIVSTLPFADEVSILAKLPNHWCRIANTLSAESDRLFQTNPRKAKRRLNRYRKLYNGRNLIAVSSGVKVDLISRLDLVKSNIQTIYNPFDFENIRQLAKESVETQRGRYIIHVGRFSKQKRHDVLLRAYQGISHKHKLVLLTNKSKNLKKMIDSLGLENRVIVAGFQANPYSWIAGADLLVLSSDHEGMPNVLIESLIVGTPVVSTDCPSGPREILGQDFPQYLTPVGDPQSLAQAIDLALHNQVKMTSINLSKYQLSSSLDGYESLARAVE